MRLDYALYALAVVFFILSGVIAAYQVQQRELWIVTTAVLGLAAMGFGYLQRPKPTATSTPSTVIKEAPPPPPSPTPVVETNVETVPEVKEEIKPVIEIKKRATNLKRLKGIGEKRAQQLKDLGINSVEDLANASAKDLATKLNISPKLTGRWIGNAKEMVKKV